MLFLEVQEKKFLGTLKINMIKIVYFCVTFFVLNKIAYLDPLRISKNILPQRLIIIVVVVVVVIIIIIITIIIINIIVINFSYTGNHISIFYKIFMGKNNYDIVFF